MAIQNVKTNIKDIQSGPIDENHRQCKDILCLILFIINICGMVYCSYYAYSQGNPKRVFRGVAQDNVVCGQPGGVGEEYPYLYFYNPTISLNDRYCVKSCPEFLENGTLSLPECYPGHGSSPSCSSYSLILSKEGTFSGAPSSNMFIGYETIQALNRVCLPSHNALSNDLSQISQGFYSKLQPTQFISLTTDILNNWMYLVLAAGLSVGVSLILMLFLKFVVGIVVWLMVGGAVLAWIGVGIGLLYNAGATAFGNKFGVLGGTSFTNSNYYKFYGFGCFIISSLFLFIAICCCKRLKIAITVAKVSDQFISKVWQILFLPIVLSIVLIGSWVACLNCMAYLLSTTSFILYTDQYFTQVVSYADTGLIRIYAFTFGALWISSVIQAYGSIVVASTCSLWYYHHGANSVLDAPILRSMKVILRYHFGSVIFGALILVFTQFFQAFIEIFKSHTQNSAADQNKCLQYITTCLKCCVNCLQMMIKYVNQTAYIQISLQGKNFFDSSRDGYQVIMNNGPKYFMVGGVGKLMIFYGRILVSGLITLLFYGYISLNIMIKNNIFEPILLLLVIFVVCYGVCGLFMNVFGVTIDTILICYVIDQMNQSLKGKKSALYGPTQLVKVFNDYKEQIKDLKNK